RVQFLMDLGHQPLSLDAPVSDTDLPLSEFISASVGVNPEERAFVSERSSAVSRALAGLKPREKMIIARRFGLGGDKTETLEEIGQSVKLTRERVRQIESKAIGRLRHPARSRELEPFFSSPKAPATNSAADTAMQQKQEKVAGSPDKECAL